MTLADRLAQALVARAARRWPADLAAGMAREWHAELASMDDGSTLRKLRFALSLAVSPAVEELGADPIGRLEAWSRSLAGAAGVTLLAGALVNAIHAVQHRAGVATIPLWFLAASLMVLIARRSSSPVLARTLTLGAALFAFLLAGNRIAVMPFMGWRDILPAVLTWTILTTLLGYAVSRTRRRHRAVPLAVLGLIATMDLTTIAGSWHAATGLGIGATSAALWFPLALLPGGAVTFGPPVAVVGLPGFHASQMLLGNASAMTAPMLLCSIFVLTRALSGAPVRTVVPGTFAGLDLRTLYGVGAALTALAAGEAVRRLPPGTFEAGWHRLLDNSAVFGFGFLATTPGRIVTAVIAGLVATHLGARRTS
nr:hypothetical protein [uncultured Actinoplanes sp.]